MGVRAPADECKGCTETACKFYEQGKCKRGDQCRYKHEGDIPQTRLEEEERNPVAKGKGAKGKWMDWPWDWELKGKGGWKGEVEKGKGGWKGEVEKGKGGWK